MSSEPLLGISALRVVSTIGKFTPIPKPKINSKLESLCQDSLTLTAHSATITSDSLTMVILYIIKDWDN